MTRILNFFDRVLDWLSSWRFQSYSYEEIEPIAIVPSGDPNSKESITSDEVTTVNAERLKEYTRSGDGYYGPITSIPDGRAEVEVDFVMLSPLSEMLQKISYVNSVDNMEAKSQAELFVLAARENHKLPNLTDPTIARHWAIRTFTYDWNAQGYYKLAYVRFFDGSSWERG